MDGLPPRNDGTQMEMTPEATNSRIRFVWLVVIHVAIGLLAGLMKHSGYGETWQAAFVGGIVLSQINLLGIWGGLGGTVLWKRLIGVVLGVGYLFCIVGLTVGNFDAVIVVFVFAGTVIMMLMTLSIRFITGAICHDRSSTGAIRRRQFSVRHLFALMSVIACLMAIGKLVQPLVDAYSDGLFVANILYGIVYAVIAIIPMWFVMATKRPVLYGICVVAVEACSAYCLGRIANTNSNADVMSMMTATATQAMSVVISLLVVRSWGYRLMPMPSRHSVVEESPK